MSVQTQGTATRETPPQAAHAVAVLDLATLRYRYGPGRKTIAAFTGTGAHLATVDTPRNSDEPAAVWAVLGAVSDSATLMLPGLRDEHSTGHSTGQGVGPGLMAGSASGLLVHRVALYNPYTAQVAYRPTAASGVRVFAGVRVDLDVCGTSMLVQPHAGVASGDRDSASNAPEWVLVGADGTQWSQVVTDATAVSRAVAAHRH